MYRWGTVVLGHVALDIAVATALKTKIPLSKNRPGLIYVPKCHARFLFHL
jgi:hypothetical protein